MSGKILGGALIIVGTTIGAGVLAVPVLTAAGGFFPATFLYCIAWLFSIASALGYLEVMTWFKGQKDLNMISMVQNTLGGKAKVAMWLVYMFLFYSLLIAYFREGGNVIIRVFECQGIDLSWMQNIAPIVFGVCFCPLLMLGMKVSDYANRILMVGLIMAFGAFVVLGCMHMKASLLLRSSWRDSISSLPIMFLAFGFQNVIPSLYYYMEGNVRNIKKAIIIGGFIPLLLYVIWEGLVLGIVPLENLLGAKELGYTAAGALRNALQCAAFYVAGEFFALFALVSSFVGVALSIMDFFVDAFSWDRKKHRFAIYSLTFLIPLVWSMSYPKIALECLRYAGGIGEALIIGVFPSLMLWKVRYGKKPPKEKHLVPGGRIVLFGMLFLVFVNFVALFSLA